MERIDLKNMKSEELKELLNAVKNELDKRESDKIIYNCECKSNTYNWIKKHGVWAKIVNAVDTNKTNGYAFIGDFLSVLEENLIPRNSFVLEVEEGTFQLFKATDNCEKTLVLEGKRKEMISFIRECKKIIDNK